MGQAVSSYDHESEIKTKHRTAQRQLRYFLLQNR